MLKVGGFRQSCGLGGTSEALVPTTRRNYENVSYMDAFGIENKCPPPREV